MPCKICRKTPCSCKPAETRGSRDLDRRPVKDVLKVLQEAGMLQRNAETMGMDLSELVDYVVDRIFYMAD